ncbi:MAG: enoyl-CoA hydratase/isomerase family protein [Sphingobium sp.]
MSQSDSDTIDFSRYKHLKLDLDEGVMTITLSNPGKKNAVTPGMSDELNTIWEDCWVSDDVSVIILTGDGNDFCSGVDLSSLNALFDPEAKKKKRVVNPTSRGARKHVYGIMDCEKPVLAKVRGVAYGMGVNMALACDMVYVSENARLCDSHVKAGMVAGDGGVLLWPMLVGIHRAKEYLMTGDPIPGPLAEQINLVNRCMPDDQLDDYVKGVAHKLRDLPPHAVNYTKSSLNIALRQMTQSAFEASVAYELYTMQMDDFREATSAFVEKRKGNFTGN